MPKIVTPLSAKSVQSLQHNGVGRKTMHPVGVVDGLYLVIYETGSRSWLFRAMLNGRRRHFGLGSARFVTLAEAREKAKAWKKLIAVVCPHESGPLFELVPASDMELRHGQEINA